MRSVVLFLSLAFLLTTTQSNCQRVSLNYKNAKLEKVVEFIDKQTGLFHFWKIGIPPKEDTVTIQLKNVPVEEALQALLQYKALSFTIPGQQIVLHEKPRPGEEDEGMVVAGPPPADVSGRITDSTGRPVAGATVRVYNSTTETTTDSEGYYTLKKRSLRLARGRLYRIRTEEGRRTGPANAKCESGLQISKLKVGMSQPPGEVVQDIFISKPVEERNGFFILGQVHITTGDRVDVF